MSKLMYRLLSPDDHAALAALDEAAQVELDPGFHQRPDREREARLSTSLGAIKFYARTDHSFAALHLPSSDAEAAALPAALPSESAAGLVLAQSVWQGDKPIILVRTLITDPALPAELRAEAYNGLLRALFKSAYDTAVYEVHFVPQRQWPQANDLGDVRRLGDYAVRYLGSREDTALPGVKANT